MLTDNNFRDIVNDVKLVKVVSKKPRDPVNVIMQPENWRCVGVGTSAAVFQPRTCPEISIKVYADKFAKVALEETEIYKQLGDSPFFPRYYGRGDNYLIIEFREGKSVHDCLVEGVFIPEQVVHDVEEAIKYARGQGLNPSDIHIKNILVSKGRGYLVDVSDYRRSGECKRWETLKEVYYDYYIKMYSGGMTVPSWLLEIIRKWYKANESEGNIKTFAERIIKMFF